MVDEKRLSVAESFLRSLRAKHAEQVLSNFPEDGTWIAPEGTFTGKARIKKYLDWQFAQGDDFKITESGNGVVVETGRAFIEYTVSYKKAGERIEYVVLCAMELKGDKVARVRTVHDRLSLSRQAAAGRLSKWAVDRILKEAERGLHWTGR